MVCMNLRAMPRLKKERPVVASFIMIRRFFSLNSTFDSARTGIWNSGSFFFFAASMTTSARPIRRSSTLAFAMSLLLFGRLGRGSLDPLRPLVLGRSRRGGTLGRLLRHGTLRPFRGHDDGRLPGGLLFLRLLLQDLVGLVAAGDVLGDFRQALLEILRIELALLEALAGFGDLLDVGLEHVAPLELQGRPLALANEARQ